MSGLPQCMPIVPPHPPSDSAPPANPVSRRRLCLSELDTNVPIPRRTCSSQQSQPNEGVDSYKLLDNVSDERRSCLIPLPTTRGRRRYVSTQSENDPPPVRHEEFKLNPHSRLRSCTSRHTDARRRVPSFVVDGPGDRPSRHSSVPGLLESDDRGNGADLPLPTREREASRDSEPGQVVEVSHLHEVGSPSPMEEESSVSDRPSIVKNSAPSGVLVSYSSLRSCEKAARHLTSTRKRPDFTAGAATDRFIPARRPGLDMRDSFVLSRPPSGLNQRQRMLRRRTGLTDPLGSSPVNGAVAANDAPIEQPGSSGRPQSRTQLTLRSGLHVRPSTAHQGDPQSLRTSMALPTSRTRTNSGRGNDAQGRLLSSGSTARYHGPKFLDKILPMEDTDLYEKRLALALDLDLSTRVLGSSSSLDPASTRTPSTPTTLWRNQKTRSGMLETPSATRWHDNEWRREGLIAQRKQPKRKRKAIPAVAFRVLEADGLRDDFYCSILAYSYRADCLAVGLGSKAYLWNEERGLIHPPPQLEVNPPVHRPAYITSLAFSSEAGGKAILALGRVDGRLMLWSPLDTEPRFMPLTMPHSAAHLSFRPQTIRRQSQRHESMMADNEVLLVGDDYGNVWVFLVEWPKEQDRFLYGWDGGLALIAKIDVHVQQICGIAWSSDGEYFSTGGNDNLCCLFQAHVLFGMLPNEVTSTMSIRRDASGQQFVSLGPNGVPQALLGLEHVRHSWRLTAAVKAMAFCPWQRGLLAAGGGSNDRCIHFYHTMSGACLATIDCAAQVTSLVWSSNRREIAATLGFPQPEHPYRIVVYAWPSCELVVAIPWHDEMRALYAIPYPGGPNEKRRSSQDPDSWRYRTADEECMVVAGSDGSIKFHEIWSRDRTAVGPGKGLLGGSDILEGLHGIEKDFGETIR